jgi:hypothetical protein
MSLRDAYFEGSTGLSAQVDAAFAAGVALVGSSLLEVTDLNLAGLTGSAFATSATGKYFDISSPSLNYRAWLNTGTETAPSAGPRTLVEIDVLSGDSAVQLASKIAAAVELVTGAPFTADNREDVVRFTGNNPGPGLNAPSIGTVGGSASVTVVTAGVVPSGQYTTIQSGLQTNATAGLKTFTVTVPSTYNPSALRGNKGNNLILKAYFAGVSQGLADQEIYNYQCVPVLNTSDTVDTKVDLNFTF